MDVFVYTWSPNGAPDFGRFFSSIKWFRSNPTKKKEVKWVLGTPPKINMEHNNGGLEDDFPFQIADF